MQTQTNMHTVRHTHTDMHACTDTYIKNLYFTQKLSSHNLITHKTVTTSCSNLETVQKSQDHTTLSITAGFRARMFIGSQDCPVIL